MEDYIVVELGDLEVIVTVLEKGSYSKGTKPKFSIDCGTDWDGVAYTLTIEEEQMVISNVLKYHSREVYTQ
jgi:hypothetical protein